MPADSPVCQRQRTETKQLMMQQEQCFNWTARALQQLRNDLMAVVYSQTTMQLSIYQRGQRLDASATYVHLRMKPDSRKASTTESGIVGVEVGKQRNLPSAKVLNDIKLDRELDTLIRIYELAAEQLIKQATCEQEQELELELAAAKGATHVTLCSAIEALQQDDSEEERLQLQLQQNQATLKELRLRLEAERQQAEQRMAHQEECIAELRAKLRSARQLNQLELTLVQKWEENRYTQADIVGANAERRLQRQIDELKRRIAGEQRLICEVESFNDKQLEDLRARVAAWTRKYAEELALKNAQTQQLEQRSVALLKQHERHCERYEQRLQFVREYLEEKAEEQRLLELQRHRVECAVRIQAWWRGVMVRRGLGPYRKKTKKGKKGKAKAK